MPRKTRDIDQAVQDAFDAAMERIKVVTGCYTQVTLAEVLEVRQSSISDAKRRASIPDGWLVKLLRSHKVLPDWLLTGQGPQYLTGTSHEAFAKLDARIKALIEDFAHLVCRVEDALEVINMTEAQLQQRKAYHAGVLSCDLERAKAVAVELNLMTADVAALQTH